MRIAIFASGNGSNFEAIAKAVQHQQLTVEIACVIYNRQEAFVKMRAEKYGIPTYYFNLKDYDTKKHYEQAILTQLQADNVNLIVLAGYMVFIGETLLQAYPRQILNIHPSLLPQFPGKSGIADAFHAKVSETGVTVHVVDEGIDTGPIIKQARVNIFPTDTLEQLEERIHQVEHQLYPEAIQEYIQTLG